MYRGPYRCVAVSIEGLVQQIAVSYLRHGYWWYVTGTIPPNKEPAEVDRKLIAKYGIDIGERERAFRKRSGQANMQYIRYGGFYVLLATEGMHEFKSTEAESLRDARKSSILVPRQARMRGSRKRKGRASGAAQAATRRAFEGYAISYRKGHYIRKSVTEKAIHQSERESGKRPSRGTRDTKWHARVEVERRTFKMLRAYFLNRAAHCSVETLTQELQKIPYEPYAPIRQQLLSLVRDINKCRRASGASGEVSYSCLRLKRLQVHPFGENNEPGNSKASAA